MLGPLATVTVAAIWGWHAGFALAAGLMLLALVIYLAGQRHLPEQPMVRSKRGERTLLTAAEKSRSRALVALIALVDPGQHRLPDDLEPGDRVD